MANTDASKTGIGPETLVDDHKLEVYREKPLLEQNHLREHYSPNQNSTSQIKDQKPYRLQDENVWRAPQTPVRPGPSNLQTAPLAVDEVDYYDSLLPGSHSVGRSEEETVGQCGWGGCNPSCLQPAASTYFFVVLFFALSFLSGFQGSYTVAVLTTLEKRFNLPSTVSGMLVTVSTLGYIVTILFIAQLGRGGHIPKIFAASSLAMTVSAILYVVPHFIYGTGNDDIEHLSLYTSNDSTDLSQQGLPTQYCQIMEDRPNNTICDNSEEGGELGDINVASFNAIAFALFVSAEIVVGVAGSPFWSVGISFLDESVSQRLSSKLLGILYTVRFVSPVVSFMLGAWFLTMYANFEGTSLTPEHPRWIGAWYLGYLLCAVGSLIVFVPMSMLPKHLRKIIEEDKKSDKISEKKHEQTTEQAIGKDVKEKSHFDNIKDMPKTIARLACNPVYLLTLFALMMDVLIVGYIIFMPKYLEVQYQMPAWKANLFGGMCPALAGGVASYISGQMSSKVRVQGSTASFCRLTVVCSALSIFTILAGMGLGCEPIHLAATNDLDSPESGGMCSSNCSCVADIYDPVCGSDQRLYLSPCHAGCPDTTHSTVWEGNSTTNRSLSGCACTHDGQVSSGLCNIDCFTFHVMFMVVSYTSIFVLNLYNVPVTNVCLRSVNKEDKAMAFAVLMFLCSIIAFPAPVIFGSLIDSTCLVHKVSTSCVDGVAQHGACLLYDRDAFRHKFHSVTVGVKVCATLLYTIPWLIARKNEQKAEESSRHKRDKDRDVIEAEIIPLKGQVDPPRDKSALNWHDKDTVC